MPEFASTYTSGVYTALRSAFPVTVNVYVLSELTQSLPIYQPLKVRPGASGAVRVAVLSKEYSPAPVSVTATLFPTISLAVAVTVYLSLHLAKSVRLSVTALLKSYFAV